MTHWTDQAACLDVDPELFSVPGLGTAWSQEQHAEQRAEAEAICAGCPVILECRRDALRAEDNDTFRGGMTPLQRKRWDRQKGGGGIHHCPKCERTFTTPQALGFHVSLGHATHCRHGHEFTPENIPATSKGRKCRTCSREASQAARARAKEAS